jgi:hypothetical protein
LAYYHVSDEHNILNKQNQQGANLLIHTTKFSMQKLLVICVDTLEYSMAGIAELSKVFAITQDEIILIYYFITNKS